MTKPTLYHGTAAARDENGNYTVFPNELTPRRQKTCLGEEGDFVFAAPNYLGAISYALKTRSDDRSVAQAYYTHFINGIPIIVIGSNSGDFMDQNGKPTQSKSPVDRKFLTHPLGAVFKVDNSTFEPVVNRDGEQTGEWISQAPTKIELMEIITVEEAMKKGVQILLVQNDRDFHEAKMLNRKNGADEISFLLKQIELGGVRHVNVEKDLNPIDYKTGKLANMQFVGASPESVEAIQVSANSNTRIL